MPVRIIVCGGSRFQDRPSVFRVLDHIHTRRSVSEVIQGEGITGVDYFARQWALDYGILLPRDFIIEPHIYGAMAREVLVKRMLATNPHGVVVFPPESEVLDIIIGAREAGIPVYSPFGQ